jgi:undecaprenyl-diphosphatase
MKKYKWIIFTLSIVLFFIMAYLVLNNKTGAFDYNIYKIIAFNVNPFLTKFYETITFFSSEIMISIISIIILLVFKNKKYGMLVIVNALCVVLLNYVLKMIFMRNRPFDLMIINETGYSFPSGHAMVSLGYYGFIIYLLWHMNLTKNKKYLYTALTAILILFVGISRIYLGVHYPSDILAGFAVSTAYLMVYTTFAKKYLKLGDL